MGSPSNLQPHSSLPSDPELPGLEWMMQSDQVTDQVLLGALLQAYYPELVNQARAVLGQGEQAAELARQALLVAASRRYRYWGDQPLQEWLSGHLLELVHQHQRKLSIRRFLARLRIKAVVRPPTSLAGEASASPPSLLAPGPTTSWPARPAELANSVARLRRQRKASLHVFEVVFTVTFFLFIIYIGRATGVVPAAPQPTPTATPFRSKASKEYFTYYVQEGDTLASIAERAGISVEAILRTNSPSLRSALTPGMQLSLPASDSLAWFKAPPPLTPQAPPPALDAQANPAEVLQRVAESKDLWQSLWVNVLQWYAGPPGYIGPPLWGGRLQLWVRQPYHKIEIFGPLFGSPQQQVFIAGRYRYIRDIGNNQDYGELLLGFENNNFLGMLEDVPEPPSQQGEWQVAGQDQVAGRPALVLDWFNPQGGRQYRIWVDAQVGLVLRQVRYAGSRYETALYDLQVTALSLDVEFPPEIFDRNNFRPSSYALDYTGQPEPAGQSASPAYVPRSTGVQLTPFHPPPGYDPYHSRLTLQFPSQQGPGRISEPGFNLYADQYLLAHLDLGQVSFYSCARSPDGSRIAFAVTDSNQPGEMSTPEDLYWLDLARPEEVATIELSYTGSDYSFSPDGQSLAVYACSSPYGNCGIYLVDLDSEEKPRFLKSGHGSGFTWSPDGEQLATLAYPEFSDNSPSLLVLEVASGETLYQAPYDWEDPSIPPDAPTRDWGAEFPPESYWLKGCAEP